MKTLKITQVHISANNAAKVKTLIQSNLTQEYLTLDLSSVDFIDSSGLGMLVSLLKTTDKTLILSNIQPKVEALLLLTRMDRIFNIK